MGMRKTHDLVVKTGEYEKDGVTKGRYQNVGAMLEGDDGNKVLLVEPWFNPAGVAKDGKVFINVWDKDRNN